MKKNRPILLTLAVFAGAMLLIVAAALYLRGRGGASFQNGDVPYPYGWTEKKNGTLLLVLDGGDASGAGAWSTDSTGDDVVQASQSGTNRGKTSFTVSPVSEGRTELIFTLRSGEETLAEAVFEVEALEADGKLGVTVRSHSERALQSVSGGEGTEHPFTARMDEYGGLDIHIADAELSEPENAAGTGRWTAESSDSLIAYVIGVYAADGGADVLLGGEIDGATEIAVSSEEANFTWVFTVTSEQGTLRLSDSRWSEYVPEPPVTDEEMDELLTDLADTLRGMETERPAEPAE